MMHRTHSCLKTTLPVPSVEALPHNAGEVSIVLGTTSALRCVSQALGGRSQSILARSFEKKVGWFFLGAPPMPDRRLG